MNSVRILMLLSNAFRPDPRVAREAAVLARNGHRLTVLCWDRRAELPEQETIQVQGADYQVLRVHSIPSSYGSGIRQLPRVPRFWRAAVQQGIALRPDIVHCHDLDTLYAGVQIKRRLGCKLIFDAHEDYPALMSLYLPRPFTLALEWLQSRLLRQVDATITASSVLAEKFKRRGIAVTPIGNYQSLAPFQAIGAEDIARARAGLGLSPETLVVAYIGGFSRNRLLLPLIAAAASLPDVAFLLWGDGHQRLEVEKAIEQTVIVRQARGRRAAPIRYLGWLPADQVPLYTSAADVIYYCLRPDYPGAEFNAPNTLSNAMAAGRPTLANEVGDLGFIVRQTGCGLLLPNSPGRAKPDPVTPQAICQAIERLRDRGLRAQMGLAGQRAAEQQYNADAAGDLLQTIYQALQTD